MITSVLCTSDSVPSSFILKISRKGSDLLKKSFGGKNTHYGIASELSWITINHSDNNKIIFSPNFSPFLPCFFHPSLSCGLQFIRPSPAFFHLSPKAQLVWISHPWPCVHVCVWRLKINIVICVRGGVGEIGGGYWGAGAAHLSQQASSNARLYFCVLCVSGFLMKSHSPPPTCFFTHTHLPDSTHTQTNSYLWILIPLISKGKLKQTFSLLKCTYSNTNLVVQLSSAEGEFNIIVITRQLLCCHLKREGRGRGR